MNCFQFIQKIKREFGNNINLITKNDKGYFLTNICGRMESSDMKGSQYKYYTSLNNLIKFSKNYSKSATTLIVESRHTDFEKALVTVL